VVPPALLLVASVVRPLYVDRYVLYAQAGLALLVGAALDRLWRVPRRRLLVAPLAAVAVAVALWPVGAHLRGPGSRTDDVTAIARAVRQTARPGDSVLFLPAGRRVWTLRSEPASYGARDLALAESPHRAHTLYGTELPARGVRQRLFDVHRVVVVRDPAREAEEDSETDEAKRAALRECFVRQGGRSVGPARIDVYERTRRC
jgi:mannosyltransferase